jgi:GR25 family glycosyltransferase involved in LPS biosynthesis
MDTMNVYILNLSDKIGFYNITLRKEADLTCQFEHTVNIDSQKSSDCNIEIDQSWHIARYGFPLPDSDIETFLTHRFCWKTFLDSNVSKCLVIEENIRLDFDLQEVLSEMKLPDDWDIFFPYDPYKITKSDGKEKSLDERNTNAWEQKERDPYLLGFNWGSSVYLLSRKGVKKLLQIKSVRQCVEDEILAQTKDSAIHLYYSKLESFDLDKYPKKRNIDREEIIRQTVLNYNVWSEPAEEILRKVMLTLSNIAKELNVDLVLHGGSLLGYVRHGSKMKWDDDIDLGLHEKDVSLFFEVVKESGLVVSLWKEHSTNTSYYKVWSEEGQEITGHSHRFPFVDVWIYNTDNNDIIFKNGIVFPNAISQPFKQVDFEGGIFVVPNNYIECLDARYKDWRNMIRIYQWNHQNERPANPMLKTRITVDDNGRIIKF